MNAAEYWDLLVRERGWTPAQFQNWLTDAWTRLLLRASWRIRAGEADLGHLPVAMSWQSGCDPWRHSHVGARSCQQLRCHQMFCPRGPAPARSSSAAGGSDLPLTQARPTCYVDEAGGRPSKLMAAASW